MTDVVQYVTPTQNSLVINDPASSNKSVIETNVPAAALTAAYGALVRTATDFFSIVVNGSTVQFRKGEVFVSNAALNAILANSNCPVI
jgi:hypothetical protein